MSSDDDSDDVPIADLKRKAAPPAKPGAKRKKESEKKPAATSRKRKAEDEDVSSSKVKKKKTATTASSKNNKKPAAAKNTKKKNPPSSPKKTTNGAPKRVKELSQLQRVDEAIKAFEWWTVPELPEGQVFRTLEHNGVQFPPAYEAHGVKLVYDGEPVDLTPEQEEVATFFAQVPEDGPQLSESGGQRDIFQKNFFADFKKILGRGHKIKSFQKLDFSNIRAHHERLRAAKKAASDAEKKEAKAQRDAEQLKTGYALLDGRLQKVGNFRMEPPSLFRGRGKHPKTGTLKRRVDPERVAINVGPSNAPPRCDIPGHAWGSVQHDDTVTWLSSWHENVMSQNKYVMLAANSSLKGKSDYAKFEKAQQLKGCIDRVRRDYRANLESRDSRTAQLATTMWLIDVYALRVGGEKGEDEADTVGCCSLRVEHFTFGQGGISDVVLEFLGKDSMLFKQTIDFSSNESGTIVYDNIRRFCESKRPQEQVFDTISPPELNAHLSSIMPGLTAKVFRTYNASETLQNELPPASAMKKLDTVNAKLVAYNEANRTVAILCNHQRTVSQSTQAGLEQLAEKLETFKSQKKDLQDWMGKKKIPLHSGEDPASAAQEAVDAAKQLKNSAKSVEDKIAATQAAEKASAQRREAQKLKLLEAHKFTKHPEKKDIEKRIAAWTEKIKKCEIDLRNKNENKEVSLGTSKANYCDPRISVAWCKRCDVPIERIFPKTLLDKFAWACSVDGDWRFEALPIKKKGTTPPDDEDDDDDDDDFSPSFAADGTSLVERPPSLVVAPPTPPPDEDVTADASSSPPPAATPSRPPSSESLDEPSVKAAAAAVAPADWRRLKRVEHRTYMLLRELFDVDHMGLMRRNFVALLRRGARALWSPAMATWLGERAAREARVKLVATLAWHLNELVWPGGQPRGTTATTQAQQTAVEDADRARLEDVVAAAALRDRLAGAIPASLASLVGQASTDDAVAKLHELVLCPIQLRSLAYTLLDLLLVEICPELELAVGGLDHLIS